MNKKNFAVVVTVAHYNNEKQSPQTITCLDFVPAVSEKEAIGIGYEWAQRTYPVGQGYYGHLVQAKRCP